MSEQPVGTYELLGPQRPEPCESCARLTLRVTVFLDGEKPRRALWEVYGFREHTAQWCRAARGRAA